MPLRNSGLSDVHAKAERSLSFFAYDVLPGIAAIVSDGNVPLWRRKRLSRTKREVKSTAHRLPGSFEDAFLLTLIDEINATCKFL